MVLMKVLTLGRDVVPPERCGVPGRRVKPRRHEHDLRVKVPRDRQHHLYTGEIRTTRAVWSTRVFVGAGLGRHAERVLVLFVHPIRIFMNVCLTRLDKGQSYKISY